MNSHTTDHDCHGHDHDHSHDDHDKPSSSTTGGVVTTATAPPPRRSSSSTYTGNRTSSYLDHRHDNTPEMKQQQRVIHKLQIAVGIICFFLLIEIIGGYAAKSLAIWSDAAHLMADLAAIMVALLAAHLGSFPVSDQHTFGLKRVESLAALFSTMSLLCISVGLAYEAIVRIYTITVPVAEHDNAPADTSSSAHHQVDGRLMSIIAFIGVLVNLTLAYVLGEHHVHLPSDDGCHHGHDHDHDHHDNHTASAKGNETAAAAAPASSHNGCSGDHHSHSHDHQASNETDDPHGHSHEHAEPLVPNGAHTEATPLLLATTNHNDKETATLAIPKAQQQEPTPKWKIPFSPQNINLQAAYLHVLGDLAQSATVLIAGCIIWVVPSFTIIDPICTLLFCILVFYSTYGVCRTSVAVLLQQVPSHLNYHSIRDKIASVQNVQDVHDLHIWSISHRVPALTVHVSITYPTSDVATMANNAKPIHDEVLENIYRIVRCEFDIIHATIQIQSTNGDCVTCVDRLCRPCLLEENDMQYHDVPDGTSNTIV